MSRALGSFLDSFAGGFQDGRDMKREQEERREKAEERNARREDSGSYQSIGEGDGYYEPGTWLSRQPNAHGSTGGARISTDPVSTDMPRHRRAMLNAIAVGESGGDYNIRYTPSGGANFTPNGKHPRIFEKGPHGPSSAAGRYQFTATTWDDMGGGEFSERRQDEQAWNLAARDYKARTGRDLDRDLRKDGLTAGVVQALSPTWAAFKGRPGRFINTYNESYSRFTDHARAQNLPPLAENVKQEAAAAKSKVDLPVSGFPKERGLDPLYMLKLKTGGQV